MSTLTKKQLTDGIKFTTKHSNTTVFTLHLGGYFGGYVTTETLFSCGTRAIKNNQYCIKSITNKYLSIWDIQFGKKSIYKVKLIDIEIVNLDYKVI